LSKLKRILRARLKKVKFKKLRSTKWIAGIIFVEFGWFVTGLAPSTDIAWVTGILLFTIYLFVFEIVNVDETAITIMVILGLTSLLAPHMGLEHGLVDTQHLFDGFASNAVVSIIAVMIIGAGLDKTGMMSKVAGFILKVGGTSEQRIIPIVSGTVGIISSFMQNVGATALFLPVVSRISARSNLPMSRLLMPMGFTAILGGTVTMVGSSPLILLNDLILTSNQALPIFQQMKTYDLFAVTPVGLALVATGIIYFVLAGKWGELDPRWNQIPAVYGFESWEGSPYTQEELRNVVHDPYIIHYGDNPKPWERRCTHPKTSLWYDYLNRTAWAGWQVKALDHSVRLGRRIARRLWKVVNRGMLAGKSLMSSSKR